uniref:ATP synthase subunit s-like protein n=1 Tax=Steinernema glaseri TaxID=37863 RepID=A0A1I8ADP1_9BILA
MNPRIWTWKCPILGLRVTVALFLIAGSYCFTDELDEREQENHLQAEQTSKNPLLIQPSRVRQTGSSADGRGPQRGAEELLKEAHECSLRANDLNYGNMVLQGKIFRMNAAVTSAIPAASSVVPRRFLSWSNFRIHRWSTFKRWQDLERDQKEFQDERHRVTNYIRMPTGLYISPERVEHVMPKKAPEDMTRKDTGALPIDLLTFHTQMRYVDHSLDNTRRFKRYEHFQHLQYDQRFIPERLLFLGADLAAAHFLVHRGAAIKLVGDDTWIKKDKWGKYSLPGRKVPDLKLEAIDASGTELMFEGFDNLADLQHLRMLRVAGCYYIDDWTMGRIGNMFSDSLEMLDLSGCHKISAKGLSGLRSLKKLRYLRLEGLDHVKDLAKTALMLEEAIPGLKVLGVDYDLALAGAEAESKLLENDRVLLDARGNAHVEDDNGRLFYVAGSVNERVTVCDEDMPLMTSTVRREIPAMPDVEFERLDRLSGGKLRHLLVGSPSGYSWTDQAEKILSFEAQYKLKEGYTVNPKMLPLKERLERLEASEEELGERQAVLEGRRKPVLLAEGS